MNNERPDENSSLHSVGDVKDLLQLRESELHVIKIPQHSVIQPVAITGAQHLWQHN